MKSRLTPPEGQEETPIASRYNTTEQDAAILPYAYVVVEA